MNLDIGPGTMENAVDMGPVRVKRGMKQKQPSRVRWAGYVVRVEMHTRF